MKRPLVHTGEFDRTLRRLLKRRPELAQRILTVLARLGEDAFEPGLKAHKLKGGLSGCFSCSVGFDLRIVFEIVRESGFESISLISVGRHRDVY